MPGGTATLPCACPATTCSSSRQYKAAAFQQRMPRRQRSGTLAASCTAVQEELPAVSRRQMIQLCSAAGAFAILPRAAVAAVKGPSGYNAAKDTQDSYQFIYPFGWQEVSVQGTDVVYKDIIEPLESASVTISKTDKQSVDEFGSPLEVAQQLVNEVLTPRGQSAKVLGVNQRDIEGRKYYEFEFATKANTYIRHALAVVTVANGKFYTLATGANENRWEKMKQRLVEVVKSFQVSERFTG